VITILEGPDLAGKSTLARQLAELHNTEVLRQGPPPRGVNILERYLRPIQDWCYESMTNRPTHLVLDRWHVGELIYGPLLRGKSLLTPCQADYIDMVLQTFGCNFIHVTAPLDVLEQRYDMRGDGLIKREQLKQIQMNYERWMYSRPHWVMDEFTHRNAFSVSHPSPLAGQYIGPRRPKVLLLGDRRNKDTFIFPFVPARATSGHWLMGALHEAKVNHMAVGIMNACELNPEFLRAQWVNLGMPPVITLGQNAKKAWDAVYDGNGLITSMTHYLNHPQYERRFHYLKHERYGMVIKRAMGDA
jgi:hypothetical protein